MNDFLSIRYFEHYTKKNEVSSFASYFAMAGQPKTEPKKEEPKKNRKEQPKNDFLSGLADKKRK